MATYRMRNRVQHYQWGSREKLSSLRKRANASEPEAEMWMGSHAHAPSELLVEGQWVSLADAIANDRDRMLGREAAALCPPDDQNSGLPFLFKILTADMALSIQAHPSRDQARRGFEREESEGVAIDARERTYRDRNHKPELICALEDFWALQGFRPHQELSDECRELAAVVSRAPAPDGEESSRRFGELLECLKAIPDSQPAEARKSLLAAVGGAASTEQAGAAILGSVLAWATLRARDAGYGTERDNRYWWVVELARQFPGDLGALAPLYLNLRHLQRGEAAFLEAQVLHAYLYGAGIEIMANSDNVLRAGCTSKHVDSDELQRILRFDIDPAPPIRPGEGAQPISGGVRYQTDAQEFELLHLTAPFSGRLTQRVGPAIVLALGSTVRYRAGADEGYQELAAGESLYLDAAGEGLSVELGGDGELFVAAIPQGLEPEGAGG